MNIKKIEKGDSKIEWTRRKKKNQRKTLKMNNQWRRRKIRNVSQAYYSNIMKTKN